MNRSGNIGAAKNMDSVFADFTDEELEQDLIFDEDDQLVEIVEGYTEDGNTIFEEDEEIFKIAHQIMDDSETPEEVKKDTEDLLGPDSKGEQNIKDIENVKGEDLDDSQTIENLKKNGESEADKELGLEKLDDEYNKTSDASVSESAYQRWLVEEYTYDYDAEDKAEGSNDKFGKEVDNTEVKPDEVAPDGDEEYNATNDATVKEDFQVASADDAEGSNDKFGKEVDNTEVKPDEVAPNGDEEYNATNDATVKEDFEAWLESDDGEEEKKEECDCGKDDCPICSKKKELAPDEAPVEDKTPDGERHEESNGENVTDGDGEGIAVPGQVDDNTLPNPEDMTPDGSPEVDNGDITDDSDTPDEGKKEAECSEPECKEEKKEDAKEEENKEESFDESFKAWLESDDLELPVLEPNETITPSEVEKAEEELADNAPETGKDAVKEESEVVNEPDNKVDNTPVPSDSEDDGLSDAPVKEEAEIEDAPTATDVADAAKTEVDDTESELDDDLAAVADEPEEGGDDDLEYDPADEDLIDIAAGEEIE